MRILVTGAAGFIGFHLCLRLLKEWFIVLGFDNLNSYYDTNLKQARLKELNLIKKIDEVEVKISDQRILYPVVYASAA